MLKSLLRFALLALTLCVVLYSGAQEYAPKPGETVVKIVVEGRGNIYVQFHVKEAPKTTAHILKLVKDGFYDGQRFHKVEKSPRPYLVETGDPDSKNGVDSPNIGHGSTGTRLPFEDSGFLNEEGAVGLAHSVDDRDSGDCQFYMLLTAAKWLDGDYTVFGKVVGGMDVLRKVQKGDKITSISAVG